MSSVGELLFDGQFRDGVSFCFTLFCKASLTDLYTLFQYTRTKSKTLRCFPECAHGVHYETSFCGDTVLVSVRKDIADDVMVLGEIVPWDEDLQSWRGQFQAGDICAKIPPWMVTAIPVAANSFLARDGRDGYQRFAFHPERRWAINEVVERVVLNKSQDFCMMVYLVNQGRVNSIFTSTSFSGKYQQKRSVARMAKRASSSSFHVAENMPEEGSVMKRIRSLINCHSADSSTSSTSPNSSSEEIKEEENRGDSLQELKVSGIPTLEFCPSPFFQSSSLDVSTPALDRSSRLSMISLGEISMDFDWRL